MGPCDPCCVRASAHPVPSGWNAGSTDPAESHPTLICTQLFMHLIQTSLSYPWARARRHPGSGLQNSSAHATALMWTCKSRHIRKDIAKSLSRKSQEVQPPPRRHKVCQSIPTRSTMDCAAAICSGAGRTPSMHLLEPQRALQLPWSRSYSRWPCKSPNTGGYR